MYICHHAINELDIITAIKLEQITQFTCHHFHVQVRRIKAINVKKNLFCLLFFVGKFNARTYAFKIEIYQSISVVTDQVSDMTDITSFAFL